MPVSKAQAASRLCGQLGVRFALVAGAVALVVAQQAAAGPAHTPALVATSWGAMPEVEAVMSSVKTGVGDTLRDPESARYRFGKFARTYCVPEGLINRNKPIQYRWTLEFAINAKNAYGAYTGYEPYLANVDPAGVGSYSKGRIGDDLHASCHWVEETDLKPDS